MDKKSNGAVGEYEKKTLLQRLRDWFKDTFSVKGKELLTQGNAIDEYIDKEVESMLEVREGILPLDEKEKERIKGELKATLEDLVNEVEHEKDSVKQDQDKTNEEKNDEIKDKKAKTKEDNGAKIRDINGKNIGYQDRLELLNKMKIKMQKEMKKNGEFVPSDKEYYKMLLLQKSIEKDREAYLEGLDDKSKAELIKLEEQYKSKELDFERETNKKYREDLEELSELNTDLRNINRWFEQKQLEFEKGEITPETYQKQVEEKQNELDKTLLAISELNPERLQEIADKKAQHARLEKVVMGENYAEKVYLRSSDEMRERLDYKTSKENEQSRTILQENNFLQKEGLDKTITIHEKHREELEKELEKLEDIPENLERRSEVLKELHIVDAKLDGYENTKKTLDVGMEQGEDVQMEMANEEKKVEEEIVEIEKDFKEIDQSIEKAQEQEGEESLQPKAQGKTEEEINKEAFETAVAVGIAVDIVDDSPKDTEHAVIAGAVAGVATKQKLENEGKLGEWRAAVNEEYDGEAVEEKTKRDIAIRDELESKEQSYERERTITE